MDTLEKLIKLNHDVEELIKIFHNFKKKHGYYKEGFFKINLLDNFTRNLYNENFQRLKTFIVNKLNQIINTIVQQFEFWSVIFYVKDENNRKELQSSSAIFKFIFVNSLFQMIDSIISWYRWCDLIKNILQEKINLLDFEKEVDEKLLFKKNFEFWIKKFPDCELLLNKIRFLRNNLMHPYSTYTNNNLIPSTKDFFSSKSTLYSIRLFENKGSKKENEELFIVRLRVLTNMRGYDKLNNMIKIENIDLYLIWNEFLKLYKHIFQETELLINFLNK